MLIEYWTSYKTVRFEGGFVSRNDGDADLPFAIMKSQIDKEDFFLT